MQSETWLYILELPISCIAATWLVSRFPDTCHRRVLFLRDSVSRFASASFGSRFPLACQAHNRRPPGNRSNFSNRNEGTVELLQRPRAGSRLSLPGPGRTCCGAFWRLLACDSWMSVLRMCILMRIPRSDPFAQNSRQATLSFHRCSLFFDSSFSEEIDGVFVSDCHEME